MKDILSLCTIFDWISPVMAVAQDLANDGGFTFLVDEQCGLSGGDLVGMLHRAGIDTYGHMIVNGTIMFSIHPKNAKTATQILSDVPFSAPEVKEERTWAESLFGGGFSTQSPSLWQSVSPFS